MPNTPFKHQNKWRKYPFKRQLKRKIRRITFMLIAAAIAAGLNYYNTHYRKPDQQEPPQTSSLANPNQQQVLQKIRAAADNPDAQFWLSIQGKVIKLLKDDRHGSQHQKFLIQLAPDITLLVAHNIDLAKRIPVRVGDQINLRGRYEWNNRGGMIHWTHHDPKGKKQGGWIKLYGKTYR